MRYDNEYDVIVVGGGHAGTEAALASARKGAKTMLITHSIETLGQMSCNPAIGGIGKSHLVKEIDALGGAMARATDRAGIQFRVLNGSKGPAVRATRAQTDRVLYKAAIRAILEAQVNLFIFQSAVEDLLLTDYVVNGVRTQMGLEIFGKKVVLTTGTFLGGKIHIGLEQSNGGRAGDLPAVALAERLRNLPFRVERLKTGTPPRIDSRTVDFSVMEIQHGDSPTPVMSFLGRKAEHPKQIPCYITSTNQACHEIIRGGLDRSPMYTGVIEGVGPRYCPSIEDKVMRFADKKSHQIFVEPEGLNTNELYPNGISTSLPFDVQINMVRQIKGFENAHITRPGYAIEYDFFDPRDLNYSLETRHIEGLYFAGQINGTTGYEEAAAQGLLAGLNAALAVHGETPWCPRRDEAYIGVLIDDLITAGTDEPYRMFTSRAEYRLTLREDNADTRLTSIGRKLGLVDDERWAFFQQKASAVDDEIEYLNHQIIYKDSRAAAKLNKLLDKPIAREYRLSELLSRPKVNYDMLLDVTGSRATELDFEEDSVERRIAEQARLQAEIKIKYKGYIDRQSEEVSRLKKQESTTIPVGFDFSTVHGLSTELKQKLEAARPGNIGRASRLPGMTPAAISMLMVYLKKYDTTNRKAS